MYKRQIAISSVLILAVSYIYGKDIIHLFVGDGNVFSLTWDGLKLFSTVFVFIGLNVFLSGYFTALGNGFISAVISLLRSLFLVVIFILVLPKLIGVSGVWLTMPMSEAVTIFIAIYLLSLIHISLHSFAQSTGSFSVYDTHGFQMSEIRIIQIFI